MPRQMPRFDLAFSEKARTANEIVLAGETSRVNEGVTRDGWTAKRLEFLYEFVYLRMFATWEAILEAIFLRSLCGYAARSGQETLVIGGYHPTIAAAETAVLAGNSYLLWHSSTRVINRCQVHIVSPLAGGLALMETTVASNQA
jgi:hypothetical protein